MIKDVDLIKYLPLYVANYEEIKTIMETENPYIQKLIDEQQMIFDNQFIESCNETGIKMFEKLLEITPSLSDTLNTRKTIVMDKWQDDIPYTYRVLIERLDFICGSGNYVLTQEFNNYKLSILANLSKLRDLVRLKNLVREVVPSNIEVILTNYATSYVSYGTMEINGVTKLKSVIIN